MAYTTKNYWQEIETVINYLKTPCLDMEESKLEGAEKAAEYRRLVLAKVKKHFRGKLISRMLVNQVIHYLDHPDEVPKLFEQWRKMRQAKAERELHGNELADLRGERAYVVGYNFLKRWAEQQVGAQIPGQGAIPGFAGFGAEAARRILSVLPQVDPRKRPMAAVSPGAVSQAQAKSHPHSDLVRDLDTVLDQFDGLGI